MAKDPLHTKLCDMLGIEFPIAAFTQCKNVAVEVINAGAFAVYAGAQIEPDELAADIKFIRDRVGGRPFGINLVFPASAPGAGSMEELEAQIPDEHRRFVESIKERHNISTPKNVVDSSRTDWMNPEKARRRLDVVLEERVRVLASGLGTPAHVIESAHACGMQVWAAIGRPRHAQREMEAGVDVVIATGYDAAAHTGSIGTFSIVPVVAGGAGDTPVLAAGGVTTGQHLAAALCLGASGVWTGTVWLASRESDEDMGVKQKIMAATAEDTIYTRSVDGFPMRALKSQWHAEWEAPDAPRPLPAPYQLLLSSPVIEAARVHGLEQFISQAAGQGVGFVTSVKPSRQIIFDMVDEARAVFENLTTESPVGTG
jgi:NAD(P)H-dependent flavin oxidoreductase YrpB (nitropropane dioxygenase family)